VRFLVTGENSAGTVAVFEVVVPAGQRLMAPTHSHVATGSLRLLLRLRRRAAARPSEQLLSLPKVNLYDPDRWWKGLL
jgi:hypothetical protein